MMCDILQRGVVSRQPGFHHSARAPTTSIAAAAATTTATNTATTRAPAAMSLPSSSSSALDRVDYESIYESLAFKMDAASSSSPSLSFTSSSSSSSSPPPPPLNDLGRDTIQRRDRNNFHHISDVHGAATAAAECSLLLNANNEKRSYQSNKVPLLTAVPANRLTGDDNYMLKSCESRRRSASLSQVSRGTWHSATATNHLHHHQQLHMHTDHVEKPAPADCDVMNAGPRSLPTSNSLYAALDQSDSVKSSNSTTYVLQQVVNSIQSVDWCRSANSGAVPLASSSSSSLLSLSSSTAMNQPHEMRQHQQLRLNVQLQQPAHQLAAFICSCTPSCCCHCSPISTLADCQSTFHHVCSQFAQSPSSSSSSNLEVPASAVCHGNDASSSSSAAAAADLATSPTVPHDVVSVLSFYLSICLFIRSNRNEKHLVVVCR